jgi:hypothetical protein
VEAGDGGGGSFEVCGKARATAGGTNAGDGEAETWARCGPVVFAARHPNPTSTAMPLPTAVKKLSGTNFLDIRAQYLWTSAILPGNLRIALWLKSNKLRELSLIEKMKTRGPASNFPSRSAVSRQRSVRPFTLNRADRIMDGFGDRNCGIQNLASFVNYDKCDPFCKL